MIKNYEKPAMKFVDVRNQQNVAGNCWSEASQDKEKVWYYDYSGAGYVTFSMGGNCNKVIGKIIDYVGVTESDLKKIEKELESGLSQHEFDPTFVKPEPPLPGEWS